MIATPTRCLFGGALASLLLLPPAALGQDDGRAPLAPVALVESVASMKLLFDGRPTPGSRIEAKLRDPVRAALNTWAPVAERLGMEVAVPEHAPVLVLGHADDDVLEDAAEWADDTHALLAPVLEVEGVTPGPVVIMVLFDREGHGSEAWPGFLTELVARGALDAALEPAIRDDRPSLTLRHASVFLQTTYDAVGDAAAGDDEFRLGNEIAHKPATFLLEGTFGRQPEALRWGLGFVAEQRLFGSSYQFNVSGFVSAGDHHGWSSQTEDWLKDRARDDGFSLADVVLDAEHPGSASAEQKCTWMLLDHLLHEHPECLATLLGELGALDLRADPQRFRPTWVGSGRLARMALDEQLEAADVTAKDLAAWARKFKPRR